MGIGLQKIATAYKDNEVKRVELTNKHFEKVSEEHKKALDKFDKPEETIEELQQQLELEILEMESKEIETVEHIMQDSNINKNNDNDVVYSWKPASTKPPF
jgi:hypothetical protein